jgi:hypothetical protein
MNFRQTLDKHLQAIQHRDLAALLETLPPDEINLIMSNGKFVCSVREFPELHRSWFEQKSWSLETQIVALKETPDMAFAVCGCITGIAPRTARRCTRSAT